MTKNLIIILKTSQAKNPQIVQNLIKWNKDNPEKRREMNIKNGKNGQILANYAKNNRDEYRKYGAKSIATQANRSYISKPEKIMKTLIPKDFIQNKNFGDYVPDFCSHKRKIIIEVDGIYWHSLPGVKEKDKKRDKYYENKGYRTFRFSDLVIINNSNNIKEKIKKFFF